MAAACGSGSDDAASTTTAVPTTATSEATDQEAGGDDTAGADDADTADGTETDGESVGADHGAAGDETDGDSGDDDVLSTDPSDLDVDPEWELIEESWFVWNVAPDDVLNVREEPDAGSAIVAVLAPDTRGIRMFSEVVWNGDTPWGVVALEDRTAWASLDFLRPEPKLSEDGNVERPMIPDPLDQVLAGLEDLDVLQQFVGDAGLTLSPDGFVGDDDIVLTKAEVASPSNEDRIWGQEAGEGSPIEMSVAEYFEWLRGSTALTSTEAIAENQVIGAGSTIINIEEAFPGSRFVEFHHSGTSYYGGLDWQSVRFVFDVDDMLVAIVHDAWTP